MRPVAQWRYCRPTQSAQERRQTLDRDRAPETARLRLAPASCRSSQPGTLRPRFPHRAQTPSPPESQAVQLSSGLLGGQAATESSRRSLSCLPSEWRSKHRKRTCRATDTAPATPPTQLQFLCPRGPVLIQGWQLPRVAGQAWLRRRPAPRHCRRPEHAARALLERSHL